MTTMCLLAAGVLAWGLDKFANITKIQIASVQAAPPGEPQNWLLVGTDSREGIDPGSEGSGVFLGDGVPAGKRTDTLIIARVNPAAGRIDLLSIPRDLWVPHAGGGEGRINSVFNQEFGEERLVDTIESYFGIDINHYAEVNFAGFMDIVEGLGGVPMWFDKPLRDAGSGLDVPVAGCHVLGGYQALAFARSRHLEYFEDGAWHSDGTGDLGRSTRQQYFLRRVADTTMKKVSITELPTLNRVLEIGGNNLVIDDGAEAGTLLSLARSFATIEGDHIIGHALPVYGWRTSGGAEVLGLEDEPAQPILDIFRGVVPADPGDTPLVVDVVVLNGSGTAGQASHAAEQLRAVGVTVTGIDNATNRPNTTIRYSAALAPQAAEVARWLAFDPTFELVDDLDTVELITGSDFSGVAEQPRDTVELPGGSAETPPEPTPPPAPEGSDLVGVVPGPTPEGTACA